MSTIKEEQQGNSDVCEELLNMVFRSRQVTNSLTLGERLVRRRARLMAVKEVPLPKRKAYLLGPRFPGVHFTQREGECMVKLLAGKTMVVAAQEMVLSYRTVEYYVKNMKRKLRVSKKRELIELVVLSDFLQNFNCRSG